MPGPLQPELQSENPAVGNKNALTAGFLGVLAFIGGAWGTIHFCRSMCCNLPMPGGWTMSMMWLRLPGQTWFGPAISFLLMWLAMMVAMMMPSALPVFLRTKRSWLSLCWMASGYFVVWLAAGIGIYVLGMAFMAAAMQSEWLSRTVPWLASLSLIAAGAIQLTRWKMKHLSRCRSPFGCACSLPQEEKDFQLGCKQGVTCCLCCAAPMLILVVLGMMNPLVIIAVTLVIATEKLFPQPAIMARVVGILAIIAGIASLSEIFLRPG